MKKEQCIDCNHFRVLLKGEKQSNKRFTLFCARANFCDSKNDWQPIKNIPFCTIANGGRGGTNVR